MRHGEVYNPEGIRYGQLPGYRLSARGRDQAREAAEFLRTLSPAITEVVASPLERAVETATIVQLELGLPAPGTDARLIEPVSVFDGLSRTAALRPRHWPRLWNPLRPSWSEPFAEVALRMRAAIAEHCNARRDAAVLVVSHQTPIWITRHSYESRWPPWVTCVRCVHGSITSLRFSGEHYRGQGYWKPSQSSAGALWWLRPVA